MKNMRLLTIAIILTVTTSTVPVCATEGINVTINGRYVEFTASSGTPYIDGSNRTQVPFRQTMEEFGAIVNWDSANQTAIAEKNGTVVKVPIGKNYIYKDNARIDNDTVALIKDGNTYLPIRAVLEAFGSEVTWDSDSRVVSATSDSQSNIMSIHFMDVGQSDSIFVDYGTFEILVDAGNDLNGNFVINYIEPYIDGNLEIIVATHAHEDHVGGLDKVIHSYQVDNIINSDETYDTQTYNDFYYAAAAEPNCRLVGDSNLTFALGGAQFKILEMGEGYVDPNKNSVVSMIDYNDVEVLLMGDLDMPVENSNLSKFVDVDVLKAGHHGADSASSLAFLSITRPEDIIISAGINNEYGYPDVKTIERFFGIGADIYATFKNGSIVMRTDGKTYSLNPSTKLTLQDAFRNLEGSYRLP